jgi:CheY-like chemotaxis protein/anti-sigma regulatory factor (Ser/Thr protein kinase)
VRPILVSSLFAPLRDEFAPEAAKRGLSLRICPSSLAVVSDAMMLRRILQNLLANALRYTRTGGVVMGCRRQGKRVRIQISDTGPGIPQAQQEAIFLEFQRGDSSVGDLAGFGLGLSIVRRFAGVLGHDIQLASGVGTGSTFAVALDQADPELVRDEVHEVERIDVEYGGLEDAKVLLIENDRSSAEAMTTLLEKWGCHVVASVSLADALARIAALGELPDAIVADLHLDHQESGLTAVQEIRQQLQLDLPAVIVTADYSEKAAKEASLYGIEVLTKPVKPAEMRALLSFLLA